MAYRAIIDDGEQAATAGEREPGIATTIALLLPITLSVMAIVLLAPILPLLLRDYAGVPAADFLVPLVLTVPALCVTLFSPLAGMVGDRLGRRPILIGALAAYGFVGVAPVFLTSLGAIIASRVCVGIAEAIIMVASTTLIADLYRGPRRDRVLAAQTAFASLSALVFFNLGGLLGRGGWRAPFWVYASALVMLALVLLFTWEAPRPRRPDRAQVQSVAIPWSRLLPVLGVTVFGSILFYTVQIQAALGLAAHGMTDPAKMGFLTSIASLGVPFGTIVYARLPHDRVGTLLAVEFLLLAVGFTLMGFGPSVASFLVGCAINQVGAGLLLPTLLVWAVSGLAFEVRARGTGLWQGAFSLGQFFSPVVTAGIARGTGTILAAFVFLGALAGIGSITALALRRRLAASTA